MYVARGEAPLRIVYVTDAAHRDSFSVRVPTAPMGVAVFAIKAYAVFLDPDVKAKAREDVARAMIDAIRMFDRSLAA
jgi:hypothetical protein